MRNLGPLIAVFCLAGCSQDFAFQDPATGATETCHAGAFADINPWSKVDLCVEEHEAKGWIVKK